MNTLKRSIFIGILFISGVALYAQQSCKSEKLTKEEKEWFNNKSWLQGLNADCVPCIDVETFVKHYQAHPERWKKVFGFLKNNDLTTLPLAKQALGDDVTVNVQEYITRDAGKELFEGHKKYIDLQYVVSGKELHGVSKIWMANDTVKPYSDVKDVGHYKVPFITYHVVGANQFTIFFPDDLHLPNIQYGDKAPVRKVVFKIKVD